MCKMFRALPQSGGVLEQDAYTIAGLKHVITALSKKEEMKAAQDKAKAAAEKARRGTR